MCVSHQVNKDVNVVPSDLRAAVTSQAISLAPTIFAASSSDSGLISLSASDDSTNLMFSVSVSLSAILSPSSDIFRRERNAGGFERNRRKQNLHGKDERVDMEHYLLPDRLCRGRRAESSLPIGWFRKSADR
eukprot:440798-Hanusia_phi.AAC.3